MSKPKPPEAVLCTSFSAGEFLDEELYYVVERLAIHERKTLREIEEVE